MKIWHTIALIFTALFICSLPCPGNEPARQTPFCIGIDSQLSHPIDPHQNRNIRQRILYQAVFSTLYRFNNDALPQPLLLKVVTIKDQTAKMELHSGLRFSDGRPLTARDVIYSLKRLLKMTQPQHSLRQYIQGADDFITAGTQDCAGLVELDPLHFTIHFQNNFSTLTYLLAEPALSVLPSDWDPDKAVYSGAYMVSPGPLNKPQEYIKLEKNPHWHLTRPNLDQVEAYFYKDPTAFYEAISLGKMDLFISGFGTELPAQGLPYKIVHIPANGQFYLLLNPTIYPFTDPAWRRFFKEIILDLSHRFMLNWPGTTSYRLVLPYGLTGYDLFTPIKPAAIVRPASPKKQLMVPIHLSRSTLHIKLLAFLSERLAPYQVKLQPIWEPLMTTMARLKTGTFSMTGFYFLSESPVAINFFERMFLPGQDLNPAGFYLPDAITLIRQYHQESSELQRMRILSQLEALAQESSFLIPVLGLSYTIGTRSDHPVIQPNRFFNFFIDQINPMK